MNDLPSDTLRYTSLQRRLHWLVIVLVFVQYLAQETMGEAMRVIEQHEPVNAGHFFVITIHTWFGALLAAVMIWRWTLRRRPVPVNGGLMARHRARYVAIHHKILYLTIILMALTGALHYYAGLPTAGRWHELGKWLLLVLIAIHVLGALSHVRGGSGVLRQMMGRGSLR
ncbi:MAG: cytochrome b [Granulosicoccus sp.]